MQTALYAHIQFGCLYNTQALKHFKLCTFRPCSARLLEWDQHRVFNVQKVTTMLDTFNKLLFDSSMVAILENVFQSVENCDPMNLKLKSLKKIFQMKSYPSHSENYDLTTLTYFHRHLIAHVIDDFRNGMREFSIKHWISVIDIEQKRRVVTYSWTRKCDYKIFFFERSCVMRECIMFSLCLYISWPIHVCIRARVFLCVHAYHLSIHLLTVCVWWGWRMSLSGGGLIQVLFVPATL